MTSIGNLNVKIFADGANLPDMVKLANEDHIHGLTTNPTLMKKAGVENYEQFCRKVLEEITIKPLSFEVFSDDFDEMLEQALRIASWGENVYVKIPVTNTKGVSTSHIVKRLSDRGVKVNVTAIMTVSQVEEVFKNLNDEVPSYVSVFAGRIADTGRDPIPYMKAAKEILSTNKKSELIWASPRELLNVVQASEIKCDIITVTSDILNKLKMIGYNLDTYSLDTVKMFRNDAVAAGYQI